MPPKRLWPEGQAVDKKDKEISNLVFKLQLGPLEYPLSVFVLFGMPLSLFAGPLTLANLYGSARPLITWPLLLLALAPVGFVWFSFCQGKVRQTSKYLFSLYPLVGAAPMGLLLCRAAGQEAFAVGAFHTTAWFCSMMPVLVLKQTCARRRPILCPGTPAPNRFIISIWKVLTQDAHTSFPSGDTAGAMAFAIPLSGACGWPITAMLIVATTATARMYWRAHFALDLVAGVAIGYVVPLFLQATFCPVGSVRWWYPLVAQAMMIATAFTLRRMK